MVEIHELKAEAFRLGFSLCGITSAEPLEHFSIFQHWIEAGLYSGMDYLASPRSLACRADPRELLPEVQTIIVLAAPYPASNVHQSTNGNIAGYAQSTDYHNVFRPRLEALADWISRHAGRQITWRAFTDSAPILEKELGQRAGLGWIGKNGCLINPQWGSFFTLAELFIDLPLPPDAPFPADRCGSCRRCLDACPTTCILPNRTLDASRCLSYLTIENKEEIPAELRPRLGMNVFGCDICQNVCPWNQKPTLLREQTLFPPLDNLLPDQLAQEMYLDDSAFRERFRHTPVARAKRRGYLRNVAVALGNQALSDAIPALASSLQHEPHPLVRAHAAWALGCIHHPAAQEALQNALAAETADSVRTEIQQALDKHKPLHR